jgi:hypothetical protein
MHVAPAPWIIKGRQEQNAFFAQARVVGNYAIWLLTDVHVV